MAALAVKTAPVSENSSSSDDETLRRCQEAVWETKPDKTKGAHVCVVFVKTDEVSTSAQISKLWKKCGDSSDRETLIEVHLKTEAQILTFRGS